MYTINGEQVMKELEITVKVNWNYKKLNEYLLSNSFKVVDKYDCYDRYMINKDLNISNMKDLDILDKCVIARDIIGTKQCLTYKEKKYDENENIVSQSKIDCIVEDLDTAIKFMESIGYKILFEVYDKITVYSNGNIEICVQYVNDRYLMIEMEDVGDKTKNHHYDNIEDMIRDFDKIGIDYDKNNYFVKKAQIILNEVR